MGIHKKPIEHWNILGYNDYNEYLIDYRRRWRLSHKEHKKQYDNEWVQKPENRERRRIKALVERIVHKEKCKARVYANNNHLRSNECFKCKSSDNLQFHHSDYKNNMGITLCIRCHNDIHRGKNWLE